jgi:hypothetical protein
MKDKQAGERFIRQILGSFTVAYQSHAAGESLVELLIAHDIIAVGSNVPESIMKAHRRAITSACTACDKNVPLPIGRAMLDHFLRSQLEEMLN